MDSKVQASSAQRKSKKRKKTKPVGRPRKKSAKKIAKPKERKIQEITSNENEPITEANQQSQEGLVNPKQERTKKVNELISEEEKNRIESYYYLDLTFVDKRKVKKNIFVGDKIFRCKLCQTAYPRLDKCQVHVWRHFNMLPYVCYACDFKTLTVTSIRGHVRKFHLKLKPFKCDQCDKSYSAAVLLKEHKITHMSSQPYRCDYCDFACLNKRVLASHMTKHKAEKDILCDICGKEFFSTKKMRAHRNTHEESNSIKCDICLAYVSTETALRRHHANVHMKDYICKVCNKKCTTRKALHNHVYQVHSDGRHQCPMCPNIYKNGSMLQDHILKHQGIRKYKCEICGKAFAQRTHVTTHMAVHDEKRHECPGCHKGFNRQDNMKVHTRNCAKFLENPELNNILTKRRIRSANNYGKTEPILDNSEIINITVKVEPIINPDINIPIESDYET